MKKPPQTGFFNQIATNSKSESKGGFESWSDPSSSHSSTNDAETLKLVCKYDDLLIFNQDSSINNELSQQQDIEQNQIKWYFNKIRIRPLTITFDSSESSLAAQLNESMDHRGGVGAGSVVDPSIKSHFQQQQQQQTNNDDVSLMNTFRIVQTTVSDTNSTISTLYIKHFSMRHHLGKYKCQYKGLSKTVRLYAPSATANHNHSKSHIGSQLKANNRTRAMSNKNSKHLKSTQLQHQSSKYEDDEEAAIEDGIGEENEIDKYVMEQASSSSSSASFSRLFFSFSFISSLFVLIITTTLFLF